MVLLYWALEDIQQTTIPGGFTIVTTTDVACHQWLRHTERPPQKHAKPVERRGLLISWDARFCFVAFDDLEQNEEGDTFTHTFTWTGWVDCMTRYFYFWATSAGEKMKSTSCIFSKHYIAPPYGPPVTAHFHPDVWPGDTSCDGYAARVIAGTSWPDLHEGAGTAGVSNTTSAPVRITSWDRDNQWHLIQRAFYLFDTSSIPEGSLIVATILHLYGAAKYNTLLLDAALNVFTSWPTTNTDIIPADYQKLDMVALATPITYAAFKVLDWNHLVFTEAGLSAIIPNGITRLAVREATYDATYVRPPWRSYKHMWMTIGQSEAAEERWADLEVTYQPPG